MLAKGSTVKHHSGYDASLKGQNIKIEPGKINLL
jgi:hypothetical protein